MSRNLMFIFLFAVGAVFFYQLIKSTKKTLKDKGWDDGYIRMSVIKHWISFIGFILLAVISFFMWLIEK